MNEERGYVYRIARADPSLIQAVIDQHVGSGWTFSGAAQWDFDPTRGRENLQPIEPFVDGASILVKGDFGHAFSRSTEVRWKRRDDGAYDVLILSEQQLSINGATPLYLPVADRQPGISEDASWAIRRHIRAAIVQTGMRKPIRYIEYLAPNGAVQFQRLIEVQP